MKLWDGRSGVYIIAEIGGNHEGDFDYAKRLTDLACDSGVDAVKFQIYTNDTIVSPVESPDRHKHFGRFSLAPDKYLALAEICENRGVTFAASVWDPSALDWVDPHMKFYKVGSGDLTAYPLLRRLTDLGKPILLSTGLSTLDEIGDAVEFIRGCNQEYAKPNMIALLQCTSMYPIPDNEANLHVMHTLKSRFDLPVGYSDHTVGTEAVEVAVAMGAEILETHFTDSRAGQTFRDHKVSLTPQEIRALSKKISRIRDLQGAATKEPTASEIESEHIVSFRRAVYANRELQSGAPLREDDLVVLRPNHGIDARDFDRVVGRTLKRSVKAFERLDWEDLD